MLNSGPPPAQERRRARLRTELPDFGTFLHATKVTLEFTDDGSATRPPKRVDLDAFAKRLYVYSKRDLHIIHRDILRLYQTVLDFNNYLRIRDFFELLLGDAETNNTPDYVIYLPFEKPWLTFNALALWSTTPLKTPSKIKTIFVCSRVKPGEEVLMTQHLLCTPGMRRVY